MLKIDHLVKNYNTFSLDCSLEVLPGQITGLVGKTEQVKVQHFMQYWDCLDRIAGNLLY